MKEQQNFDLILPFLRPIEHLILDESISEIMVNAGSQVFIERDGMLEAVPDVSISEAALNAAVRNIARRLGDDVSELTASRSPSVNSTPGTLRWRILFALAPWASQRPTC
jgi:Flp pilus assembly CpaF family ATPase